MKKYNIQLSKDQLILIANALEDVSRFASGQCELENTISKMLKGQNYETVLQKYQQSETLFKQLKKTLLPELHQNQDLNFDATEFIGNTYQIYRTILHTLHKDDKHSCYSSPALSSGNLGTITITEIE